MEEVQNEAFINSPEVAMEAEMPSSLPKVSEELLRNPDLGVSEREKTVFSPERSAGRINRVQQSGNVGDQSTDSAATPGSKALAKPQSGPVAMVEISPSDTAPTVERKYIDKAKSIIASTSNNPHGRDESIKDLKEEYMLKRYGVDINRKKK